jgi:Ca2+-binding EF-hand superfamily protein
LALRSTQLKFSQTSTIDKNTFVDFVNLPGAVSDRFFALACEDSYHERIELSGFLKVMLDVYGCSLEARMKLVFDIFDFNGDHLISAQEVKMILSYIPFVKQGKGSLLDVTADHAANTDSDTDSSLSFESQEKEKPTLLKRREGLYVSSMGKHMTGKQRTINTEQIDRFVKCVFA